MLAVWKCGSKDVCGRRGLFPCLGHGSWVRTDGQIEGSCWSLRRARRGTSRHLTQVKQFKGIKKEKNFFYNGAAGSPRARGKGLLASYSGGVGALAGKLQARAFSGASLLWDSSG